MYVRLMILPLHTSLISRILCYSPLLANTEKTRLLGNFFGNKEQCRLYFQFNTPVQYHLKVRHRMSSRSCLAALFSAGDRLTAPEKGYTINPNNKIHETVIVAQISCSRSAKLK